MGKFHITITNNETGKVLSDTDTDAIIGAFTEGEGTRSVCYTECDTAELAAIITGALQIINKHMADMPSWLQRMIKKASKKKINKNT
jgi:hypothetical protein